MVKADLQHIRNLAATLKIHHRGTTSINILGKTLKVIAGTPDFDDWEQIKFKQEQLSRTEESQKELNIKFQDRLNELTNTLNRNQKSDQSLEKFNI